MVQVEKQKAQTAEQRQMLQIEGHLPFSLYLQMVYLGKAKLAFYCLFYFCITDGLNYTYRNEHSRCNVQIYSNKKINIPNRKVSFIFTYTMIFYEGQ